MKAMLLSVLLLLTVGGVSTHLILKAPGDQTRPGPVEPAQRLPDDVAANGVVEGARPEAALRPEVAGILAALYVRENQDVKRGDVLAELHNVTQRGQVELARAEVALAKAHLVRLRNGETAERRRALAAIENSKRTIYEQAKAEAERSQQLASQRSVSREQYDRDRFRMISSQAEWEQAAAERALVEAPARADEIAMEEAKVAAAEARLRLAEAELAKTKLLAPADGRVLQVFAEPGEAAGPSSPQPVLLLADLSRRRVRAFVEELDVAQVRPGQKATVTADALPDKAFAGTIADVLPRMGKRAPQSDAPGEYKDVYFREVLIDLGPADDLPLNLRVYTRVNVAPAVAR